MKRQNIIVVISPNDPISIQKHLSPNEFMQRLKVETFGNFKKMCETKGFPYHSLKTKDFPFTYLGFEIHRTPFL